MAVYDNSCEHLSGRVQPRSHEGYRRPSRPKKRVLERSAGSTRFYPGTRHDRSPGPESQHRSRCQRPCGQCLLLLFRVEPGILFPRQKRGFVAIWGHPSINRFESLLLLNAHCKTGPFQHWGESESSHLPTTFLRQAVEKSRSFLIDVVVPRKIREVYGLLVIGDGALKLNL